MEPDREKIKTVLAYAYMALIILITFALLMRGS
jgi:hypothetical protein